VGNGTTHAQSAGRLDIDRNRLKKYDMRLFILLFGVASVLAGAPAGAQQGQPSPTADAPTAALPVSLARIRQALEQAPVERLKGLNEQPTFKVEIQEHQKFQDLLSTLDFKSGPVPPGGLYAYEMLQLTTPKIFQPYAVFNQRELLVIALENLLGKYLFGHVIENISDAERARAEQAAREEVDRALAKFLAAHPDSTAASTR
jgi:hypothetical protein